jgi:hypothetical protein
MASAPDLNGTLDEAFEKAKAHVLAHMPREYRGHAMDKPRVGLDQDRRVATFDWGGVRAVADAQVIGLYLEAQDHPNLVSWRWGWSTHLFQDSLLEHVMRLKKWGDARKLDETTNIELLGYKERFWGYGMIAATLCGASGVVGLPRNDAMIIMTIGPLRDA